MSAYQPYSESEMLVGGILAVLIVGFLATAAVVYVYRAWRRKGK